MSRPEVTLENYDAVYKFYRHYKQPRISRLGYMAMDWMTDAQVDYDKSVLSDIADHISDGGRLAVVMNHLTDYDQNVVAGLAHLMPGLHFLMGHTIIPAKASLFRKPHVRLGIDIMGAIPTWREKDTRDDVRAAELRRLAGQRLLCLCARRLEEGDSLAMFPEGERNDINPEEVQGVKHGLGKILVDTGANVATLEIGLQYREGSSRRPSLYLNPLSLDRPKGTDDVVDFSGRLSRRMQDAVNEAIDRLP